MGITDEVELHFLNKLDEVKGILDFAELWYENVKDKPDGKKQCISWVKDIEKALANDDLQEAYDIAYHIMFW